MDCRMKFFKENKNYLNLKKNISCEANMVLIDVIFDVFELGRKNGIADVLVKMNELFTPEEEKK